MPLPFELTTLPKGSLDIIRFLAAQDAYAAHSEDITDATGLSEKGFGKAIRRLVTKEYVEMQYDGPYALTESGLEAAEAIFQNDEDAQAEASFDDAVEEPAPVDESLWVSRKVLVVYPSVYGLNQPGYLFVRVVAPEGEDSLMPVDMIFEAEGGAAIFPDQVDVVVPAADASETVRFEVTPNAMGEIVVKIDAVHVTQLDLVEAGSIELALNAGEATATTFKQAAFDITFEPGK